jgi:hypothetical protein
MTSEGPLLNLVVAPTRLPVLSRTLLSELRSHRSIARPEDIRRVGNEYRDPETYARRFKCGDIKGINESPTF